MTTDVTLEPGRSAATPPIALRDVAVVLCLTAAMAAEGLWFPYDDEPLAGAGWLLLPLTALPALVRRRAPAAAVAACMAVLFLTTDYCPVVQTAPLSAMLCGYWLARDRGRRAATIAAILIPPTVLFLLGRHGLEKVFTIETPKNLAFVALPLVLGLATRYRRESVQALIERAETAERTREEEALRRVGEERLRIARDVHDVVSHSMVAINVQAGVGAHLIDRDVDEARRTLIEIRRISAETLTDLRAILGLLRDDGAAPVEPTQTLAALPALAAGLSATGLDVSVSVSDELSKRGSVEEALPGRQGVLRATEMIPTAVDSTAYRIVQEALTNVLRHAGTHAAEVRVHRRPGWLEVEVRNGVDAPAAKVPSGTGNGLRGMSERVAALGGRFTAGPSADGGWLVHAELPLPTKVPTEARTAAHDSAESEADHAVVPA